MSAEDHLARLLKVQTLYRENDRLQAENEALRSQVESYEEMFAKASHVQIKYAPEVYIVVHPKIREANLHYRERKGDWLNNPDEVDTDFTGERKWKQFRHPLEAFQELLRIYPKAAQTDKQESRENGS